MIKAIETRYKGYRFRSRLEARWAVFFDALNLEWEYEKEGYDLGDGTYYLPDFWLPELEIWYEVKGKLDWEEKKGQYVDWTYYISKELVLAEKFKDAQEWPVACSVGQVGDETVYFYAWDLADSSAGSYSWDDAKWCYIGDGATLDVGTDGRRTIVSDNLAGEALSHFDFTADTYEPEIQRAYQAARSARFEHGESG